MGRSVVRIYLPAKRAVGKHSDGSSARLQACKPFRAPKAIHGRQAGRSNVTLRAKGWVSSVVLAACRRLDAVWWDELELSGTAALSRVPSRVSIGCRRERGCIYHTRSGRASGCASNGGPGAATVTVHASRACV